MAETPVTAVAGQSVEFIKGTPEVSSGSAGVPSQVPGQSTSVSAAAAASGGIAPGNLIAPYVDKRLFQFRSDDTPLMTLMLSAKPVKVNSPVVRHYMVDEPRYEVTTSAAVSNSTAKAMQVQLPLEAKDAKLPTVCATLLCHDVDGYDTKGANRTPGRNLMLYVVGRDATSQMPIVVAVNGPKEEPTMDYSYVPDIPAGTRMTLMSTACSETQMEVEPDLVIPAGRECVLQKRVMNVVASDYFDAVEKNIPFSKAIIAEAAIANYKLKCNRSLWAGVAGHFKVNTPIGPEDVYTSEGIRTQFLRELQHTGKWSYEEFVSLAKLIFTGEDVPSRVILLCGKNFLENVQCIDFSKHPEISITTVKLEDLGWEVTKIHTVFGDFLLKREPTLDRLGWSNSAAAIGDGRIVHYVYTPEKKFSAKVEGREAKRTGLITQDAIALKGSCHIWIDGDGAASGAAGNALGYVMWSSASAPTSPQIGVGYVLTVKCPGISADAEAGQIWVKSSDSAAWALFKGVINPAN